MVPKHFLRLFFHIRTRISCAHNISAAHEILRGDPKLRTYLKKSIRRSQRYRVTCIDAFPTRTVLPGRARRFPRNTMDTHLRHRNLDGFTAQTTVSNGYEDETATEEDIRSDLANSLPLETLRRGCSNQFQLCTRVQTLTKTFPCATGNWLLNPASNSAQDGLDPLQFAMAVTFQSIN